MNLFEQKLRNTLEDAGHLLDGQDVLVIGSNVLNVRSVQSDDDLFVTQDLDVGMENNRSSEDFDDLDAWEQSDEAPSVYEPVDPETHLEINLVGVDRSLDLDESEQSPFGYVNFGNLTVLESEEQTVNGVTVRVATLDSFITEKLLSDRTGIKGDRDRQVAARTIDQSTDPDLEDKLYNQITNLPDEHAYQAFVTVASLAVPANRAEFGLDKTLGEDTNQLLTSLVDRLEADQSLMPDTRQTTRPTDRPSDRGRLR